MTVTTQILLQKFSGNGSSKTFSFPIQFYEPSDLMVELIDAAGAIEGAVLDGVGPTGYVVTGTVDLASGEYRSGGSVVFNAPPPAGTQVLVLRDLPLTQPLDLQRGSKFPANAINAAFDRSIMIDQQLQGQLDRALLYPLEGGAYDAHGRQIAHVGTPTHPEDAATKSYIDNGGWTGAIAGNQYVDGIYVDTRGTGTPDDTAIWTQAIADAVSLGYYKLYFRRPTNVKNLVVDAPVEIIGVHGVSVFNLAASAALNDVVLRVTSGGVKLRGFKISMPVPNWLTPAVVPIGGRGILIMSGTTTANSRPLVNVALDDITVIGGQVGVWFIGGDVVTINNLECRLQFYFGCVLGGNLPVTKCRVQGFRAVSCGSYGMTLSQLDANAPLNYGYSDIEILDCYLIDCGKFGLFNIGIKYGADMTTTSLRRLKYRGESIYCGGGLEIKNTLGAVPGVLPSAMRDIDVSCNVVVDHDIGGGGIIVVNGQPSDEVGSISRIVVHDSYVHYVGPKTWVANYPFDVGDAISNAGLVYWCAGDTAHLNGLSGGLGPPTGTGTGLASYFDGNLYWYYIGGSATVPPSGFIGFRVDAVGDDAGNGLTLNNIEFTNCAYTIAIYTANSTDNTNYNVILDGVKARNCARGIYDGGNPLGISPGFIKNLRLIDCDFDCLSVAVQLGAPGSGTTGSSTVLNAQMRGGRFRSRDNSALYVNGSVDLKIGGGARLSAGGGGDVAYLATVAAGSVIQVEHAHFETEAGNHYALRGDAAARWDNVGSVNMINPTLTNPAVADFSSGTFQFRGQVCRGIVVGNPNGAYAGHVGEYLKLAVPTSAISEYVCTVTGTAGVAVWTPRL